MAGKTLSIRINDDFLNFFHRLQRKNVLMCQKRSENLLILAGSC